MISATYGISGGDFDGAGAATRTLKGELARVGVEAAVMRRIMIAAYEAEMNVVIHARKGSMWARIDDERLDLEIIDEGPGIPDVDLAMKEGYSTASDKARQMGFGAGMGLPNIKKCSDLFEIESRNGEGTRVRSTIFLRRLSAEEPKRGSLLIRGEKCRSCMDCVKACPTGALRVHGSGPRLLPHLCIDCAACIAACPARIFDVGEGEGETMRLPAPGVLVIPRGFASGFPGGADPSRVLAALRALGFSRVRFTEEWEAALAAAAAGFAAAGRLPRPAISPSCPAIVNLIESHFPSLIPHLAPFASPLEAAAQGFALSPACLVAACPAQFTAAARSRVTGRVTVIAPRRLAEAALPLLGAGGREDEAAGTGEGAGKSTVDATNEAASNEKPASDATTAPAAKAEGTRASLPLRVTGIRHVLAVLEQIEGGGLSESPVIELFSCDQGCIGSPLFAADPFVAALKWRGGKGRREDASAVPRKKPFAPRPGLRLDPDMAAAIEKLSKIGELTRMLPGRDCAACGAPACAAFAEDVVLGRADESACPYKEDRV